MTQQRNEMLNTLSKIDISNLDGCKECFSPDLIWHYENVELPEQRGEVHGVEGLNLFFQRVLNTQNYSLNVEVIHAHPVGDELLLMHTRNRTTWCRREVEFDVALIWRFEGNRVVEVWDVPAVTSGMRILSDNSSENSHANTLATNSSKHCK